MDERGREEQIRRRAQELWEAKGQIDGHHERHWHDASEELDPASAISAVGEQTSDGGAGSPKVKSRAVRPSNPV